MSSNTHERLNLPVSKFTMKLLSMYLAFPNNEPITAVDFRARDGEFLKELTSKHTGAKHLYAVEQDGHMSQQMRDSGYYEKVSTSNYQSESRISKDAFSLCVIDPVVSNVVASELFDAVDTFVEPNFEEEERRRLTQAQNTPNFDEIDLGREEVSEEEQKKQAEAFQKKLDKSIENRRVAYRRALREQEKRLSFQRSDNYILRKATDHLMPGGVLVMVTPKELIDTSITLRLTSQYENIKIIRLEEDEYLEKQKCIILATKRKGNLNHDRSEGHKLAETKLTSYKDIEEVSPQIDPTYYIPSQKDEAIELFRVGPLTPEEVLDSVKKSSLLETYQENYSQTLTQENPVAPTPLHKGHIMLLLTSGLLNGYIGKGVNQHLVKGNAIKMIRERTDTDDEGVETIKEKEYYHISVKYLNSQGEFHKLM